MKGRSVGYARVSTTDQDLQLRPGHGVARAAAGRSAPAIRVW